MPRFHVFGLVPLAHLALECSTVRAILRRKDQLASEKVDLKHLAELPCLLHVNLVNLAQTGFRDTSVLTSLDAGKEMAVPWMATHCSAPPPQSCATQLTGNSTSNLKLRAALLLILERLRRSSWLVDPGCLDGVRQEGSSIGHVGR